MGHSYFTFTIPMIIMPILLTLFHIQNNSPYFFQFHQRLQTLLIPNIKHSPTLFPTPLLIHLKLFTQRRNNGCGILLKKLTFSSSQFFCQFSTIFAPYHHSIGFIKSFYKNKNKILKSNHHYIQFQNNYLTFFHSIPFSSFLFQLTCTTLTMISTKYFHRL